MDTAQAVEPPAHPVIALINSAKAFFCRQGSVVATWRQQDGRRFGPYYQLAYRQDGRQRRAYLGREGPLVEAVRQLLGQLHGLMAQQRAFVRTQRTIHGLYRAERRRLRYLLAGIGLRSKGWDIRGWRTCSLAGLVPGFKRLWRLPIPSLPQLPRLPSLPTLNQIVARYGGNPFGKPYRLWKAQQHENRKNANSVDQAMKEGVGGSG